MNFLDHDLELDALTAYDFMLDLLLTIGIFFAALLVENGKFLLSAKRTRRTTCTEYVISMDADNISRSSNKYIGKLRWVLSIVFSVILLYA